MLFGLRAYSHELLREPFIIFTDEENGERF